MKTQEEKDFQRDLIISLVLHLVFVVIFVYGIPTLFKKPAEEHQVITFEMLTVSDIVNVRNQDIKKPEPKEVQESKKIEKSATKNKEEVKETKETPTEKTETSKKESEILPEKKEEKKEKVAPKKEEPQKKVTPPKKEKELPKKPIKKQEDVIDSILQNLEKESDGEKTKSLNRTTSSQQNEGKFARGNHDEDSPLSITERMLIKQQINENWNKPAGIENIKVTLSLKLDKDGTVIEVKIKDSPSTGNKQLQDLVNEGALRAAKKASPIKNLRPDRYDVWKEFDLNFDLSNM
jgi:outer membrane biosynthesis protein TonB